MEKKQSATFIIGALFVTLFVVTALLYKSTVKNNRDNRDASNPYLVESNDPLVTKKLSERDLLPEDTPIVTFIDPQRGSASSNLLLVEFSDFGCPFCREVQENIKQIIAKYPNDVRHVWKDAPNEELHKGSVRAHVAARCAGKQGKFWEYHDALFSRQPSFDDTAITSIAGSVGVDLTAWQSCFDKEEERA